MKAIAALALAVALVTPALAADPVTRTYAADFDRVWAAAENALTAEGWRVDDAARPLGLLVTKTQRLAGDDDGMQAITQRVRLRLTLTAAGAGKTRVQVQREVFRRERVLWIERDEGVPIADGLGERAAEERVLGAIGRQL